MLSDEIVLLDRAGLNKIANDMLSDGDSFTSLSHSSRTKEADGKSLGVCIMR